MRWTTVASLSLLLAVGCGPGAMPRPSPKEYPDVVSALVLRGATVTGQVAGDAGCSDPSLSDNAVRLDVSLAGAAPAAVYLMQWRRESDFAADDAAFDACVAESQERDPVRQVTVLESSPWRAYGAGWGDALRDVVTEAIQSR